jgi:hypothetical protein
MVQAGADESISYNELQEQIIADIFHPFTIPAPIATT